MSFCGQMCECPYKCLGCRERKEKRGVGKKKGNWGEKRQKQLSAAQIPASLLSLPAVFSLFSRLKTRSWSFRLKGKPDTCAFISFFLSIHLFFPLTLTNTHQRGCASPRWHHIRKGKKNKKQNYSRKAEGEPGLGQAGWGQTGGGGVCDVEAVIPSGEVMEVDPGRDKGEERWVRQGWRQWPASAQPGQRGWTPMNLGRAECSSRSRREGQGEVCAPRSLSLSVAPLSCLWTTEAVPVKVGGVQSIPKWTLEKLKKLFRSPFRITFDCSFLSAGKLHLGSCKKVILASKKNEKYINKYFGL